MSETSAITRDDPRYKEMFSVENEVAHGGGVLVDDPYPAFARLRADGAVFDGSLFQRLTGQDDHGFAKPFRFFSTLSFKASDKALIDNDLYSSLVYHEMPGVMQSIGHTLLTMVGREHARYRSAIQPMMTRDQAMGWWTETWIVPFVETIMNELEARQDEPVDLALMLCARLPMHTVTAAYGLSSDDAVEFREKLLGSMSPLLTPEQRAAAVGRVREILLGFVAARRSEPRDDLISRLVSAPFTDAHGNSSNLSDEDILSFSRLLLLAGGGTTYRQLGIVLFALLSDREQLEALRADRSLMEAAIEEAVRWNCTDPIFNRLATRDSVLEGVEIPAGSVINVCLGAANRDPSRWDNPDAYDLHRPRKRHLGFAAGPHTCLGRFVAGAEMTAAINALLDRFPNVRLARDGEPAKIVGGLQMRGVNHLRVHLN
jgi:cytochrome P450